MTLVNEPDSTARNAIVQRDLSNVLHPIVQHKQLERQQLVVVGAHDSTIVDADGTE
jgi:taurine-pyruvate aminotransferase